MSLRFVDGTPGEQLRSDLSHAASLEDQVLLQVFQIVMEFASSNQDTERLLASLSDLSKEHGVNPTLLKHSARGLVHISFCNWYP
jgi:hypothetical protein